MLLIGSLALVASAALADVPLPSTPDRYAVDSEDGVGAVRDKYGIDIRPIRMSGAGYMLDFRYRVVDAEKATAVHKEDVKPYVFDSGEKYWTGVPATKVGSLRQTKRHPREGVMYTTMLANPGRHFQPGDTVSLVLGRLVLDQMVIQSDCASLTADLRGVLNTAKPEDRLPILIEFGGKADVGELDGLPENERRAKIVAVMHQHARAQQARVRDFLESSGAQEIRELWITNALAASVPAGTIGQFCDWPEVDRIRFDREVAVPDAPASEGGDPE